MPAFWSFVKNIHKPAIALVGPATFLWAQLNQCRVCEPPINIIPHAYRQWINIKWHYTAFRGTRKAPGMAGMMRGLELDLVGHHHSGIDDSRNIARIARLLGENEVALTITHQSNPPKIED